MVTQKLTVGMPQLSYNGLDLVWLQKTAGNMHWQSLGDLKNAEENGQRLYASFFYSNIKFETGLDQSHVQEDDEIELSTDLRKHNRQIYQSVTDIKKAGESIATITLESAFIKKAPHNNQLIRADPPDVFFARTRSIHYQQYKNLKQDLTDFIDGQPRLDLVYSPEFLFNGVKILYFANYLQLIALSEFCHFNRVLDPISSVEIVYFSNVDATDILQGTSFQDDAGHYQTILCKKDGKVIGHGRIKRSS